MIKFDHYNFDTIEKAFAEYDEQAVKIMKHYRTMAELIKEESKSYKDETGTYNRNMKLERERARNELTKARREFQSHVNNSVVCLEASITSDLMTLPDPELSKTLGIMNDMGIELSQTELEGLINQANGNYLCLRSIAKLAEKSGYKLDYPTLEDLKESLTPYKRAAEKDCYCPNGYLREGMEIFGAEPTPYTAEDGSIQYTLHALRPAEMLAKALPVQVCKDTTDTVAMWSKVTPSLEKITDAETKPAEATVTAQPVKLPDDLNIYRYNHTVI